MTVIILGLGLFVWWGVGGGGWRVGWGFVDMPLGVGVLQKIDQKVSRF